MKIKVLVEFKAQSVVEVEIPDDTPKGAKTKEAVLKVLERPEGLPEVIKNPTINFLYATSIFLPKPGKDPFFSSEPIELGTIAEIQHKLKAFGLSMKPRRRPPQPSVIAKLKSSPFGTITLDKTTYQQLTHLAYSNKMTKVRFLRALISSAYDMSKPKGGKNAPLSDRFPKTRLRPFKGDGPALRDDGPDRGPRI